MEEGESGEETLPTVYGIMIAFLTCVVGYVLWVSVIIEQLLRNSEDSGFARNSFYIVCLG